MEGAGPLGFDTAMGQRTTLCLLNRRGHWVSTGGLERLGAAWRLAQGLRREGLPGDMGEGHGEGLRHALPVHPSPCPYGFWPLKVKMGGLGTREGGHVCVRIEGREGDSQT